MPVWANHFLDAIWPNVAAEPFVAALAFSAGWFFRDRIGKKAAKWWDKHHGPHARARHLEALSEWHASATVTASQPGAVLPWEGPPSGEPGGSVPGESPARPGT